MISAEGNSMRARPIYIVLAVFAGRASVIGNYFRSLVNSYVRFDRARTTSFLEEVRAQLKG